MKDFGAAYDTGAAIVNEGIGAAIMNEVVFAYVTGAAIVVEPKVTGAPIDPDEITSGLATSDMS